jgi:hypothetical protein
MKNIFFLILFLSVTANAGSLTDRIHSVIPSGSGTHIVRFEAGRVGFVSDNLSENIRDQIGAEVRAEIDETNEIRSLNVLKPAKLEYDVYLKNSLLQEPPAFETTKISSGKLKEIWKTMNPNFKRLSECTDRAHVWAWDEFKKSGTKSQKAFIFFTASYINRVRFKWWFHVAPMFDVETSGGIQKMVTDVMYLDRPVTLKEWTNLMVFSGRDCKMTTNFSEYDVNPQTEDCYMIHESMFYRLPGDIHAQELSGTYRSEWNESEVNGARVRAFHAGRIQ